MKAPEKIYLVNDDLNVKREWFPTKQVGFDTTEYTRTDGFIDKASEWLCYNYDKYIRAIGGSIYPAYSDLCRDFQNYMKGE